VPISRKESKIRLLSDNRYIIFSKFKKRNTELRYCRVYYIWVLLIIKRIISLLSIIIFFLSYSKELAVLKEYFVPEDYEISSTWVVDDGTFYYLDFN